MNEQETMVYARSQIAASLEAIATDLASAGLVQVREALLAEARRQRATIVEIAAGQANYFTS